MYTVDKDDGDGDATVVFSAPSLKVHGRKLSSMWEIDTRCWVSMSDFHIFVEQLWINVLVKDNLLLTECRSCVTHSSSQCGHLNSVNQGLTDVGFLRRIHHKL